MIASWKKYFDPLTLNELAGISLRRSVMTESGPVSGTHRSTRHGHSVEFAEHRPYAPGDDVRSVDWKLYGKTDRYFLRHREDETTLICHLLVDASGSMAYRSPSQPLRKWDYAGKVAAALAFAAVNGQDVFSFHCGTPAAELAAGGGEPHLGALAETLDRIEPQGPATIGEAMFRAAAEWRRQGLAVVVSDLLDEPAQIFRGVDALQLAGQETILVQVLDPEERRLSGQGMTRYEGLEGEAPLELAPELLREAYQQVVARFLETLQAGCTQRGVGFLALTTDQPVGTQLAPFLAARM